MKWLYLCAAVAALTYDVGRSKSRYVTVSLGLGHTMVVACILAFVPWLMGIPGVQGDYAIGWLVGYRVLTIYPIAWFALTVGRFVFVRHKSERLRDKALGTFATLSNFLVGFGAFAMVCAITILWRAYK